MGRGGEVGATPREKEGGRDDNADAGGGGKPGWRWTEATSGEEDGDGVSDEDGRGMREAGAAAAMATLAGGGGS